MPKPHGLEMMEMGEDKQPTVLILYAHELLADGIRALLTEEGIRSVAGRAD